MSDSRPGVSTPLLIGHPEEVEMRKFTVLLALVIALGQWGCQFHAGDDFKSYYQMNQLDDVYREQRITRPDYELRKGAAEIAFILY